MKSTHKISVLFVCMGNICRSPAGAGVFQHYVEKNAGTDQIQIDSAGTIAYHAGAPTDVRMREVARQRGYTLLSRARKVTHHDLDIFDLVVAMDSHNLIELEAMTGGPQQHIRLLGTFINGYNSNANAPSVPDPYYGGTTGFEQVLDMIESACPRLLAHCLDLLNNT